MDSIDIENLDWNRLWQQEKSKKTWKSKNAADWDKKAASFAKRTSTSIYIDLFLQLLNPRQEWSILDIGCGPGTLALPLASRVRRVSGLDFSEKMLAILQQKAAKRGLANITLYHGSWEDDWQKLQIAPHDVAIASRSLAVADLKAALVKLSSHAREKVVITDRVKHGPFDPDAFAALRRPLKIGPDYIYTLNLLYQMGYLPRVDYIELEKELCYPNAREAMDSYLWMFRDLDDREKKLLKNYVQSITTMNGDGSITLHRRQAPTWAFISWNP